MRIAALFLSLLLSGMSWVEIQPAGNVDHNWFSTALSADGARMLVGEATGRLYLSANGGATWTEPRPAGDVSKFWESVAMSATGQHLAAQVSGGRIYLSHDYGVSWAETRPEGDVDVQWYGIVMSADCQHMALLSYFYDAIYISHDCGATWSESAAAGPNVPTLQWSSIAMSADGQVIVTVTAGGPGQRFPIGRVFISLDSGVTWHEGQPAGNVDRSWNTVSVSADGLTMIVGASAGRLYVSFNSGATWTEVQPAGNVNKGWKAAVTGDGYHMVAGVFNGRLYATDDGLNWYEIQPGGNVNKAWRTSAASADGRVLLAGANSIGGRLYRLTD